jgi:hypothetical protein
MRSFAAEEPIQASRRGRWWAVLLVGSGFGLAGVWQEMRLTRHLLVDCYPFKMMSDPPADLYAALGRYGPWGILGLSLLLIPLLQLVPWVARRPALMPAILTAAAPAMFWVGVLVAPWVWPGVSTFGENFDGETGLSVAFEFGFWMLGLAVAFDGLGWICGLGLGLVYPGVRVVKGVDHGQARTTMDPHGQS